MCLNVFNTFSSSHTQKQNNTFQTIVITDHTSASYTVFTYKCGDLNWAREPTIGFNAASLFYANHPDTGADDAHTIDCTNGPDTYYTLWYNISAENFVPPPPTPPVEPGNNKLILCINFTAVDCNRV